MVSVSRDGKKEVTNMEQDRRKKQWSFILLILFGSFVILIDHAQPVKGQGTVYYIKGVGLFPDYPRQPAGCNTLGR